MDKKPVISIVVPVYKIKEEYLRQCIESLCGQTFGDIEIILVDDGSPDNDGGICDEYAKADGRVRVIHQKNQGTSAARNAGIEAAAGDYIMFVDADDWVELDCCEQVLHAAKESDCDVVFFQRIHEYIDRSEIYSNAPDSYVLSRQNVCDVLLSAINVDDSKTRLNAARSPYCKLIRRDFLIQNDLRFVPGIVRGQDNVFNLYLYEVLQKAYFFNYYGYHYRINNESITNRYNEKMPYLTKDFIHEFDKFVSLYQKDEDEYRRALGVRCINAFQNVETCFLFHERSKLKKKECIHIVKDYLNDDTVKTYGSVCRVEDFKTAKSKVRFVLLSHGWFTLYYWIMKAFNCYKHVHVKRYK